MSNSYWIDYSYEGCSGTVPVGKNDEGTVGFCDGAYDVFDLFYNNESDEQAAYDEFERIVCEEVSPKLESLPFGDSVTRNINGVSFTFKFESRDHYGNT